MTNGTGSDGDVEAMARLRLIVDEAARRNQGSVLIAQAVKSTRARAVEVLSVDRIGGDQPAWVIQVEGIKRFTCVGCHRRPRAPSPRGRFLTLVLDAQTLTQSDFGIGDVKTDLSQLGEVIVLVDESR